MQSTILDDLVAHAPQILQGLGSTVLLAALVTCSGLVGGIAVFRLLLSANRAVRRITDAYVSLMIGTPLIVFLFLMYYGLPQWGLRPSPLAVAVAGFTLNVSAYNARYLLTACNSLDPAELEAARAQGFDASGVFRWITLPQSLRLAIPALTNQAIQNLKDTSVAFLIQYVEFFAQMQEVASRNFRFFQTYVGAGLVYLVMVSVIVLAARRIERRFAIPGVCP